MGYFIAMDQGFDENPLRALVDPRFFVMVDGNTVFAAAVIQLFDFRASRLDLTFRIRAMDLLHLFQTKVLE
ncbi:MAG: hypothetical protein HC902_12740 [Calothrix sp. SM1_5_4]|nr:hypothetical protein [Calothrix sp. SM1_5_4]